MIHFLSFLMAAVVFVRNDRVGELLQATLARLIQIANEDGHG